MTSPQIITATAYSKNRILSVGQNSYTKSHPRQQQLALKVGQPHRVYLHAETLALLRAIRLKQQVVLLEVTRYGVNGNMLLARPCAMCRLAIGEAGVREVRYTSPDGWITELVEDWLD